MAAQIRDKFYQWPKVTATQIWPPKYGQFLINIKRREPMVATLSSNGSHTRPRGNLVYHITVNRDTHAVLGSNPLGSVSGCYSPADSNPGQHAWACIVRPAP